MILLVEDSADDELLTLRALRKHHVANEVHIVRDGQEALDYLFADGPNARRGPLPSIVLLDLNLPKVDGNEVLRRIRANESTRLLPVIILTSSKEEEDVANSYSLGANAYVRKPVDFAQFAEAIRVLGVFWLVVNQPAAPQSSR